MKFPLTALAAAALALGLPSARAEFKLADNVSLTGFGTLAASHSSDGNSDFVGTIFQPNGAGHTKSVSFGPDSKLGVQLNATLNDKVSAVVQVLSQHQYDNSWKPQIEWANIKYQLTPEVSVRLGRIALPTYLTSESRFVGYSSPLVRPPLEVYTLMPVTNNDGIDATWRTRVGEANNALQVYYGKNKIDISTTSSGKANKAWGVNDTVELGALTLRASYLDVNVDLTIDSLTPLLGGIAQFAAAPAPIGTQAAALLDKYKLNGMKVSVTSLGLNYDPGDWFVTSEVAQFKGAGFLSDTTGWYLSGGYRIGSFTPYAAFAAMRPQVENETGIDTPSAAALNAGLNGVVKALSAHQETTTLGVRWDFMKNASAKAQYDRIALKDGSAGRIRPISGLTPADRINVLSLSLDFVF